MPEIRNSQCKETVCIDTYRGHDSCRDKDCFENVRVYLTGYAQEIIERNSAVRAKYARVLWSNITIDTVPFNRGFYQLSIKIYVKICAEVCVSPGNIQEIEGIAVVEKKVILFGSEGNVSVFKSEAGNCGFCTTPYHNCSASTNLPIAVLETVDPIILGIKVVEPEKSCNCCCCCDEIPDNVLSVVNGNLTDDHSFRKLVVSLGFFSVVRIERPAQYLINAVEYSVPDKECMPVQDDDPCSVFRNMTFPTNEFYPPSACALSKCDYELPPVKKCGCNKLE